MPQPPYCQPTVEVDGHRDLPHFRTTDVERAERAHGHGDRPTSRLELVPGQVLQGRNGLCLGRFLREHGQLRAGIEP
jgi:hypothetical protein